MTPRASIHDHRTNPYIAGSLSVGWLAQTQRMKMLLFYVYGARAVAIACYLAAPKTALTFYIFGAVLGLTWLATVPPTAGLVGKLLGARYLATLFGLTLFSHQIGGFFGAWLGGVAELHAQGRARGDRTLVAVEALM